MKQLVQNLRTGETFVLKVPVPLARKGYVLIRSRKSLISAGTERMLVRFAKAGFLAKARQQPDKLRLVLDKIRTDGFLKTTRSVLRRLDQLLPLGYCNVGEIVAIGDGVEGFTIGDRVVSNGPHAEMVCVPVNLVAKVPANVPDDEAAFAVLGAVGLHAVRLLAPALGELLLTAVGAVPAGEQMTTTLFPAEHGLRFTLVGPAPHLASVARGWRLPDDVAMSVQSFGPQDLVEVVVPAAEPGPVTNGGEGQ